MYKHQNEKCIKGETKNELNAIEIFSGAGGMSLGATMAGINIVTAVENNTHAANTFRHNHPHTKVICEDIRKVSFEFKETFLVFGGPPCQGFSVSNTKTRNLQNENNSLFKEFVRAVKESQPNWFVFENVEGFVTFFKGKVLNELKKQLELIGYVVNTSVLTASDYGVPQNRNRFFMVGNKLGINFKFPPKTTKKVTVKDAIGDLPSLNNGQKSDVLPYKHDKQNQFVKLMRRESKKSLQNYVSKNEPYVIERYKHIGAGENWRSIPVELMKNYAKLSNCHSGIYRRLHPDEPSIVIANYRKNMLIHPFEDRGLSVREAARIQSFPDNFVFQGSLMHMQQQIGNAVPPLLAKAIFDQIIKYTTVLLKDNKVHKLI